MAYRMGVLLIHGMGQQERADAAPMIRELCEHVTAAGGDADEICFESAWWAPVLEGREKDLLRRMEMGNDLDWMKLRRFVVHSLGDAIAYQDTNRHTAPDQINVYQQVHARIAQAMAQLRTRIRAQAAPDAPEVPLVVIAHSLGCHMISNYIWDVRDSPNARRPGNPFEAFETLTAIVMFGCNIPLFTLAYTSLEPIHFPTANLSSCFPPDTPAERIAKVAQWLNFYDPDDVLGYPLRSLDPKFAAAVTADVEVNVGKPWSSWNPLSHTAYWTDDDVTKPTAQLLRDILELL
jgi:hypothetical protein